jgi:hypothetical protein
VIPLLKRPTRIQGTVEVARSFSYKLNCGNYESRDFFCSQKAECPADEAEAVSQRLHEFCKSQVMQALRDYLADDRLRKGAA